MKCLTVILIICFEYSLCIAQIHPFKGIYDQDSCKFSSSSPLIRFSDSAHTLWQVGKPSKPFFGNAYSAPFAIMTDSVEAYPKAMDTYFDLILPQWYPNVIVGFKHKYETDANRDGGYIEVSYDSGRNWNNVIDEKKVHNPMMFYLENMYQAQDSLAGGINGFSGLQSTWLYSRMQWVWLVPLFGPPPRPLYLRFHFISDTLESHKSGWIVDDIMISIADMGTGIGRVNKAKLRYYPNPMSTETTFMFPNLKKEAISFQLFNSQGQMVKTQCRFYADKLILERGELNSGLYYFRILSENGFQASGSLGVD